MVNQWLKSALAACLPQSNCALCLTPTDLHAPLCSDCSRALPRLHHPCQLCAVPLPELPSQSTPPICGRCRRHPPPYQRTCIGFAYAFPCDQLITGFKFHHRIDYGRALTKLLAAQLLADYQGDILPQALIPVPLHRHRLAARGYNQAGLLAHWLGQALALPVYNNLTARLKSTPPQSGLSAHARRRNLRQAFSAKLPTNLKRIAIVDDVVTTGTTASLLAKALTRAGAEEVHLWAIARPTR